ncbi:hypothetical protein Ae505Ps2_0771c [Pseudonocardia sp. Ae505_Ps2]|nr:hypothetical protein Ae505Ps2_0771c [Pseudonocardia sp. Ae505_Ps2]
MPGKARLGSWSQGAGHRVAATGSSITTNDGGAATTKV